MTAPRLTPAMVAALDADAVRARYQDTSPVIDPRADVRDLCDEIDRLRADVSAMLPIVEELAAISADHCCGHDDARRFLDARKVSRSVTPQGYMTNVGEVKT